MITSNQLNRIKELECVIADMRAECQALRADQPAHQEPVAWRYTDARGHYRYRGFVANFDKEYPMLKPQALCTAPQPAQRKPLTNLEGLKLAYRHPWLNNLSANAVGRTALRDAFLQGVRDAEAAHGIKENT